MDKDFKRIIWISLVFLVFGGIDALVTLWSAVFEFLWGFFPIFGKAILEDYFTSPHFWTSITVMVLSILGIMISAKVRKRLYTVISIVIGLISLASIAVNILMR